MPTRTVDEIASRQRAIGAGLALLVVALTYRVNGFDDLARWWAAGTAILLGVVLADALGEVRSLLPTPGLAPLAVVAALTAIAGCVPETDQLAIAAVIPSVVVLLEVVLRSQVGLEWYAVAAASVAWAGLFGATGRTSALAGALFAWWPVVLVPLVHRLRPIAGQRRAIAVGAIGAVAAVVMARTGGIADSGTTAGLVALAAAAVSLPLAVTVAAGGRSATSTDQPSSGSATG